jgi:ParB-like chromosome segregation protein Spo0J
LLPGGQEAEHSERAAENIVRTQLDPYQEAQAVAAMLANGLSDDGAAQALGWPKARVTARMRLLELPEAAQQMVGAGQIALRLGKKIEALYQRAVELTRQLDRYAYGCASQTRRSTRRAPPAW